MRLERSNNLLLNTATPNFVAIFVFFGSASSFIERISFSEMEAKREVILFLFGCSEVNSTWIITSGLANQRAPKALFNGAETNCGIAHNLGILLMNSYNTDIYFLASTIICSLSTLNSLVWCILIVIVAWPMRNGNDLSISILNQMKI